MLGRLSCGALVQFVAIALEAVGLEYPARAVLFPAIFRGSHLPRCRFFRHECGEVIARIAVCIASNAGEIVFCQFELVFHWFVFFVCIGKGLNLAGFEVKSYPELNYELAYLVQLKTELPIPLQKVHSGRGWLEHLSVFSCPPRIL